MVTFSKLWDIPWKHWLYVIFYDVIAKWSCGRCIHVSYNISWPLVLTDMSMTNYVYIQNYGLLLPIHVVSSMADQLYRRYILANNENMKWSIKIGRQKFCVQTSGWTAMSCGATELPQYLAPAFSVICFHKKNDFHASRVGVDPLLESIVTHCRKNGK